MLVVNEHISIPLREFRFTYVRSSGPGGQNVNKVNSKVQLHWNVRSTRALPEAVRQRFLKQHTRRISGNGELYLSSQRFRDQGKNVADVLNKLRKLVLSVAVPEKKRKPTKVSRNQKRKRLENKRRQSERKRLRRTLD